ncbi:MAG: hypothetical protein IJC48_04315 [Clostridia bacterium]|nr:hypothetical protein [Clostridia bacterium]
MNKTKNILSIISIALAAAAILLSACVLQFLWEPICFYYMNGSTEAIEAGPMIPIGSAVHMACVLIFALMLRVCFRSVKNIAPEIVTIAVLFAALPALSWGLQTFQMLWLGQKMGVAELSALAMSSNVFSIFGKLTEASSVICIVICIFRISDKVSLKKIGINEVNPEEKTVIGDINK